MSKNCQHNKEFESFVNVNIIEDTGVWMAELRIMCAECGMPMRFLGLPHGLNLNGAAVTMDGLEARLAITDKSGFILLQLNGQTNRVEGC